MIDFSIDPEFAKKLVWVRDFCRDAVEPLEYLFENHTAPYDTQSEEQNAYLKPLQDEVRRQGLWGLHLPAHHGGPGLSQVQLCLLNEILGRTFWAPRVFGCQAPDSGNGEIIARYGTPEQKTRYLDPLQAGEIVSCFAMTEVEGGSDPTQFTTKAVQDGDDWIISGEKWFASNARFAEFLIVMCVTDPDAARYERMSTFLVPRNSAGLVFVSEAGVAGEPEEEGSHAHLLFDNLRIPADAMLGPRGGGFKVAQARLGGGRIHHAMRTIGMCQKALDMMGERALSRVTQGETFARKQLVQVDIGQSWIDLQQFRLLVLRTAWMFDQGMDDEARTWIAACKVTTAKISLDIVFKAMHMLGSLGVSNHTPLARMWSTVLAMGMADGPTEIHQMVVGRAVLKDYSPAPDRFPTDYLPRLRAEAKPRLDAYMATLKA